MRITDIRIMAEALKSLAPEIAATWPDAIEAASRVENGIPGFTSRGRISHCGKTVKVEFAETADAKAFYEFLTPGGNAMRLQMERVNVITDIQALLLLKEEISARAAAVGLQMNIEAVDDMTKQRLPSGQIAHRLRVGD